MIDPQWLQDWISRNGPYLYHGTQDPEGVAAQGIHPHGVNAVDPQWDARYLRPRDGHVYLGTPAKAASYVDDPSSGMVSVDLRKLDPALINADEDAFRPDQAHNPQVRRFHEMYGAPLTRDEFSLGKENMGAWANRVGLGNNPEDTKYSLEHGNAIAYNGSIPPEAIQPGYQQWNPWEEYTMAHVARAEDSLHIGIPIPRNAASHIHRWAQEQQWPEGTELEPQSEYHMTLLFVPGEGHEHKDSWWVQHIEQARLKISGFEVFPSKERGGLNAYVLRVESPEAEDHARKLIDSAQWVGLEPSHPEQFKGHITVAYGPDAHVKVQAPTFEFDAGPSEVSPRRYDKAAATNSVYGQPYESSVYSGEAEVLDHLSLASVAHNLHYKFEQGQLDPQGAVEYAEQLLGLIGYPADKMTTQAAIQAWQQLYPQDRMLAAPDVQPQITAKTAAMEWQPGTWGKGLILDGQLHTWPTGSGDVMAEPHHGEFLGKHGVNIWDRGQDDRWSDPIVISPEGYYTTNDPTGGTKIITPERFAQAGYGLKYDPRERRVWRTLSKVAAEDYWMDHRPASPADEEEEVGAPFHAIDRVMPDYYEHPEYYMYGHDPEAKRSDREAYQALMQARGNPNAPVTIYRAGPGNVINNGDWVTQSLQYAKLHARHPDDSNQDMPITRATVPASSLWTHGDDHHEFGYWGEPVGEPHISSVVQKNLPSSQANYVIQSDNWDTPGPSDLIDAGETVPPSEGTGEAHNPAAAQAAIAHTGQIPGDEQWVGEPSDVQVNPNKATNPSYIGSINGRQVYIKPQGNNHPNDIAHERAAFAVSRAMGVPVPHTTAQSIYDPKMGEHTPTQIQQSIPGNSLLREWIGKVNEGAPDYDSPAFAHRFALEKDPQALRQIALLDSVIGNKDRHLGNIVRDKDGNLWGIDHGASFTSGYPDDFKLEGEPLTPEELKQLRAARKVDVQSMGVSPQRHQHMLDRIDQMLATKRRLGYTSSWDEGAAGNVNDILAELGMSPLKV